MDANLSISSSPAASALSGAGQAASGAAAPGAELRGADFANLLRGLRHGMGGLGDGLQDGSGRQDLAADGLAQAGLQAVALSPQLELITAASPVPDADSLLAFGRTQGLDDGTLALLFGVPGMPGSVGAAGAASSDLAGQGAASLLTGAAVPAAWALGTGVGAKLLNADAGTGVASMSWQISKAAGGTETTVATTGVTAVAGDGKPDTLAEALRIQLQMPREAITALTKRLAGLSGNGQAVAWGQLQAQAMADAPEVLNLREFFTGPDALLEPALAPEAGDAPAPGTLPALEGGRSAAAGLTLQSESAAPTSQAGLRAEQYQQLADRLGQALAQRLQAQIERGEWKLQMRMDPRSLGRIDLELDMRAGGLDAVFRSDNPLTRELIAQGLPKLRDSLAQSGTTVAHVWVNGDSAGQPGGNPTPQSRATQEAEKGSGRASGLEAPVLPSVAAKRASDSDWDLLA